MLILRSDINKLDKKQLYPKRSIINKKAYQKKGEEERRKLKSFIQGETFFYSSETDNEGGMKSIIIIE